MSKEFVNLANETQASTVQGSSVTAQTNQPIIWAKDVIDAAKRRLYFANFINSVNVAPSNISYIVKKRTKYLGKDGVTFDTGEATTSDISNTSLSTLDGVELKPTVVTARFTETNYAIRTNAFNIVEEARKELAYAIGDRVDNAIAVAIGNATKASSTAAGATELYGGDAVTDATLSAGDVITTDLVAKAARILKDDKVWYWNGSTFTKVASATATKNPWENVADDPFVLFISPMQEEVFRKDSQFVNAAEYGSNIVVQNGEIGMYLGIRIVVTSNVESVASGSAGPDGDGNAGTDMTRCILCKPKAACTIAWGQQPTIDVAEIQWRKQQSIVLECAYDVKVIHDDAIVFIDVADQ